MDRRALSKRTNEVNNINRTNSDITSYKNPLNTHTPITSTASRNNNNNNNYPLNNNPNHITNIHKRKLPSNLTTSIIPSEYREESVTSSSLPLSVPDSEDVLASHALTELQKKVKPSDIILSQPTDKITQNTVNLRDSDENMDDFYCHELLPIELLYTNELTDNLNNTNNNNIPIDISILLDNLLSKCYSLTNINISDQNYQTALRASYDSALNYIEQLQQTNEKLNKQLNEYNSNNKPMDIETYKSINEISRHNSSESVLTVPSRESELEAQIEQLRKELTSTKSELSRSKDTNQSLTRHHFNAISLLTSSYHHQFKSAEEQRDKFKSLYEIRLEQFKQTLQNNDYNYQKQLKKLTNNIAQPNTETVSLNQQLEIMKQNIQQTSGRTYASTQ